MPSPKSGPSQVSISATSNGGGNRGTNGPPTSQYGPRHGNFSKRRQNHAIYQHKSDPFIEWIKSLLRISYDLDVMEQQIPWILQQVEILINEHREYGDDSRLARVVSDLPLFFTDMRLKEAFLIYNRKYKITQRRFVYPTFNEIRHIVNLAQVLGIQQFKLITFDGDQTLYADQQNFEDVTLAHQLLTLLQAGISIALVTAANYALSGPKYEVRLRGLLDFFCRLNVGEDILQRFYIVAGESNFLLKIERVLVNVQQQQSQQTPSNQNGGSSDIASKETTTTQQQTTPVNAGSPVTAQSQQTEQQQRWHYRIVSANELWPVSIETLTDNMRLALDTCEMTLRQGIQDLNMKGQVLRKKTSVGCIVASNMITSHTTLNRGNKNDHYYFRREQLDELVFRLQETIAVRLRDKVNFPYCAFNGGNDVWFDIGNKREGISGLQKLLEVGPENCLHVGDQMAKTGNDYMARFISPVCWIVNPSETKKILKHVIRKIGKETPNLLNLNLNQLNQTQQSKSPTGGEREQSDIQKEYNKMVSNPNQNESSNLVAQQSQIQNQGSMTSQSQSDPQTNLNTSVLGQNQNQVTFNNDSTSVLPIDKAVVTQNVPTTQAQQSQVPGSHQQSEIQICQISGASYQSVNNINQQPDGPLIPTTSISVGGTSESQDQVPSLNQNSNIRSTSGTTLNQSQLNQLAVTSNPSTKMSVITDPNSPRNVILSSVDSGLADTSSMQVTSFRSVNRHSPKKQDRERNLDRHASIDRNTQQSASADSPVYGTLSPKTMNKHQSDESSSVVNESIASNATGNGLSNGNPGQGQSGNRKSITNITDLNYNSISQPSQVSQQSQQQAFEGPGTSILAGLGFSPAPAAVADNLSPKSNSISMSGGSLSSNMNLQQQQAQLQQAQANNAANQLNQLGVVGALNQQQQGGLPIDSSDPNPDSTQRLPYGYPPSMTGAIVTNESELQGLSSLTNQYQNLNNSNSNSNTNIRLWSTRSNLEDTAVHRAEFTFQPREGDTDNYLERVHNIGIKKGDIGNSSQYVNNAKNLQNLKLTADHLNQHQVNNNINSIQGTVGTSLNQNSSSVVSMNDNHSFGRGGRGQHANDSSEGGSSQTSAQESEEDLNVEGSSGGSGVVK